MAVDAAGGSGSKAAITPVKPPVEKTEPPKNPRKTSSPSVRTEAQEFGARLSQLKNRKTGTEQTGQDPPPRNNKIKVNTPVTRAVRPVVAEANNRKREAETDLSTLKSRLGDKERELAALSDRSTSDRVSPSILELNYKRIKTLKNDISGLDEKIEQTQKRITTADATNAAGNVVLYGEQAKADSAAAKRSGDAMKTAHEDLAKNLPKGISLRAGETLSTDQVNQLKPGQRATYDTYLDALQQARTDQAETAASIAAGNFNHSKLQKYASDPKTGGAAKNAMGEVNDALRPLNLRLATPKPLARSTATKNLDAAGEVLEQANVVRDAAGQTPSLDPHRTEIANDMIRLGAGGHYQGVKSSAMTELLYATRDEGTPGDQLDELVAQMKARRPGDEKFNSAVDAAAAELGGIVDGRTGQRAGGLWESLGRSHKVLDPITRAFDEAQRTGDMGKFKGVVTSEFEKLGKVNSTVAAIEGRRDLLLRFGLTDPADKQALPAFRQGVSEAAKYFLQDRPQEIADGVRETYDKQGDLAAAEALHGKLSTADPVTAALALTKASGTINEIGEGFSGLELSPSAYPKFQEIYNDLSGAVENASRSPDGRPAVDALAKILGANSKFSFAQKAVGDGRGATLSVEVARNAPAEHASVIRSAMGAGLNDLKKSLLDKVTAFAGSAMSITEPVQKWGPLLKPDQIGQAGRNWQSEPPGFLKRANDDLAAVDKLAGQYFGALTTLQGYGDQLAKSDTGQRDPGATAFIKSLDDRVKETETDPKLKFGLQFSRSTFDEAVRALTTEKSAAGESFTPKELQQIIDNGVKAVESGIDPKRIATYAGFGVLPSFFLLSKIKYGVNAKLSTAGLLPEQFLRDGLVSFAAGASVVDNPVLNAALKATIADLTTLATNTAMNKYLGPKSEAFRVPPHLLAGRLAIPPIVGGADVLLNHLRPEGIPPSDNIGDWLLNRTPDAAQLGLSVGIPGTVVSVYGEGLKKLYPNGNAPTSMREAYRGGKLLPIMRAGASKIPGTFGFITGIVALQYFGSEALFERPPTGQRIDLPPVEPGIDGAIGPVTSLGSLAAPALISGPLGWAVAAGVALGGQVIQGSINDARRAAQFEGPTRSYLEAAGIRPEIANVLADYDDNGYDVAGRINALAQYRGVSPRALLQHLDGLSPEQVRTFVNATHHVEPDEAGRYTVDDSAADYFGKLPVYGSWMPSNEKYQDPNAVLPHSVAALNWWTERFLPGLPAGQPTAPPSRNVNSREYQAWLKTPGGRAWTANQDRAYLARALGIPNVPVE